MKTILVLTDFSEYALFALRVAASIAKKIKGKIDLIYVYRLPFVGEEQSYNYANKYYEEISAKARTRLDFLVGQPFLKGVDVKPHVVSSTNVWEVINVAKFKNPLLIVMGTHGTSGYNQSFIGSNTEKIVRLADAPVLTIKNEIDDFAITKMVFASDFLPESYLSFKKIKFFADLYHAHIDLLKVITPKEFETTPESLKLLHDFARKFKLKNYSSNIYNDIDIEKGILNFSSEKNADLIAIETHGRTGLAHLINGSLAEEVVKHETKPVLSVKTQLPPTITAKRAASKSTYESWGGRIRFPQLKSINLGGAF